jgi:hypothetical protein
MVNTILFFFFFAICNTSPSMQAMRCCGVAGVSRDDVVEATFDTMRLLLVGERMPFPFPAAGFPLLEIGEF